MDLAFESEVHQFLKKIQCVSILVLMDLAFEYPDSISIYDIPIGFNPCFNGSCIRIMLYGGDVINHRVSILVLMDLAFEYKKWRK